MRTTDRITVKPSKGLRLPNLIELWEKRELMYFLMWRDVKLRYKQTVFGVLWAVLQPFVMMLVFSFFFGKMGRMPSDGIPYPVFCYTALVPWTFFSNGITQATSSLVFSSILIKKIYFPRIIIPLSSVMSGAVDFLFAFAVLIGMSAYYGIYPNWHSWMVPALFLLMLITAIGVGLWFSALNVLFRDVRYVIPMLTQVWMFSTPIIYPLKIIPGKWRVLMGLNPMASVVAGFRWGLLGTSPVPRTMLLLSLLSASAMVLSGLVVFGMMEKTFEDMV
ncbi:MAG TPA: ABC transporter permease [Candidatus Omnitrophota bacterium]|nr:ABC transporter permease [Candidatus Omnitrophota bacterium]